MKSALRTKTVRQVATFPATPHEIYEMLMDSKKHSNFTGAKARISRIVGGRFNAWDGWIEGRNKELVKDKRIVQWWRGADWPEKHYSIAIFKLGKKGRGTKLDFVQKGVPDNKYKDISKGWKDHYWEKMRIFLKK